jgi:hypothetical protein
MLERIQQRAAQIKPIRVFAWTVAAIPLAIGYVLGVIVKVFKLAWAAFVEGYEAGVKL